LSAATSFYALHELCVFALDNAPAFAEGADFGKAALEKIFALPIRILPFVSRVADDTLAGSVVCRDPMAEIWRNCGDLAWFDPVAHCFVPGLIARRT
jgi:hypothetical protein